MTAVQARKVRVGRYSPALKIIQENFTQKNNERTSIKCQKEQIYHTR